MLNSAYGKFGCFNPCFAGFPFRTPAGVGVFLKHVQPFQSLFCWISVSDRFNTNNI